MGNNLYYAGRMTNFNSTANTNMYALDLTQGFSTTELTNWKVTSGVSAPNFPSVVNLDAYSMAVVGGGISDVMETYKTKSESWASEVSSNNVLPNSLNYASMSKSDVYSKNYVLYGGLVNTDLNPNPYSYDSFGDTWSSLPGGGADGVAVYGHSSGIYQGGLYIIGGINGNGILQPMTSIPRYYPQTGMWDDILTQGTAPEPRVHHQSLQVG